MNAQIAVVYDLTQINHELVKQGYTHAVSIYTAEGRHNTVDFKNEFAAQTYADSINLKNGEDNA